MVSLAPSRKKRRAPPPPPPAYATLVHKEDKVEQVEERDDIRGGYTREFTKELFESYEIENREEGKVEKELHEEAIQTCPVQIIANLAV